MNFIFDSFNRQVSYFVTKLKEAYPDDKTDVGTKARYLFQMLISARLCVHAVFDRVKKISNWVQHFHTYIFWKIAAPFGLEIGEKFEAFENFKNLEIKESKITKKLN